MTILVLLVVSFLFNENSDLCLWKRENAKASSSPQQMPPQGGLTPEEMEIWRRLNEKQIRLSGGAAGAAKKREEEKEEDKKEEPEIEDLYMSNLMRLRG